jgi:hypothetical protein
MYYYGLIIIYLKSIKIGDMNYIKIIIFLFVSSLAPAQSYQWAKSATSTGAVNGVYSTTVDAAGNVYTTGFFQGTADFDPGIGTATLTSAGGVNDIFIAKYDINGSYIWAKAIGNVGDDRATRIALDGVGNIVITGYFEFTVDFDPGVGTATLTAPSGVNNIFFSKYDNNGNYLWANGIGSSGFDYSYDLALDGSGNIFITGYFEGTADFDPGVSITNLSSFGNGDIFFAKYDGNGNYLWAYNIGSTGTDFGNRINVDALGNVYITGHFRNTVDFDPGVSSVAQTSAGNGDLFFAKYDANGNYLWAKRIGNSYEDYVTDLALDGLGNIYLTGNFRNTVDFDPSTGVTNLVTTGNYDLFFAKYDSNGNYLWAKRIGGAASSGIAVDASGEIFLTGVFTNVADFDLGPGTANLTSAGVTDIFFGKYDFSGNYIWANSIGSTSDDISFSIELDGVGNLYISGYFVGTVDFDPSSGVANLVSAGNYDLYFAKYNSGSIGIESVVDKQFEFSIFPNPFDNETTIKTNSNLNQVRLIIYNALGQEVKMIKNISDNKIQIEKGDLQNGIYFVHLAKDNKLLAIKKIVITD